MNISELEKDERFRSYAGNVPLWGDTAKISVYLDDEELAMSDETAEKAAAIIEKAAAFINENRKTVEQALIENDFISLAEDWASSAEEAEDEERECYIMEDGSKVFFPITEEDFTKSLHIDGAEIYIDTDHEYESVTLYLVCQPDYFAFHAIEVDLGTDGTVEAANLAG